MPQAARTRYSRARFKGVNYIGGSVVKNTHKFLSIGYFLYGISVIYFIGSHILKLLSVATEQSGFIFLSLEAVPLISFIVIALLLMCFIFWLSYLLFTKNRKKTCNVLAVILLIGFPVATVLGIITLWVVNKTQLANEFSI